MTWYLNLSKLSFGHCKVLSIGVISLTGGIIWSKLHGWKTTLGRNIKNMNHFFYMEMMLAWRKLEMKKWWWWHWVIALTPAKAQDWHHGPYFSSDMFLDCIYMYTYMYCDLDDRWWIRLSRLALIRCKHIWPQSFSCNISSMYANIDFCIARCFRSLWVWTCSSTDFNLRSRCRSTSQSLVMMLSMLSLSPNYPESRLLYVRARLSTACWQSWRRIGNSTRISCNMYTYMSAWIIPQRCANLFFSWARSYSTCDVVGTVRSYATIASCRRTTT